MNIETVESIASDITEINELSENPKTLIQITCWFKSSITCKSWIQNYVIWCQISTIKTNRTNKQYLVILIIITVNKLLLSVYRLEKCVWNSRGFLSFFMITLFSDFNGFLTKWPCVSLIQRIHHVRPTVPPAVIVFIRKGGEPGAYPIVSGI